MTNSVFFIDLPNHVPYLVGDFNCAVDRVLNLNHQRPIFYESLDLSSIIKFWLAPRFRILKTQNYEEYALYITFFEGISTQNTF